MLPNALANINMLPNVLANINMLPNALANVLGNINMLALPNVLANINIKFKKLIYMKVIYLYQVITSPHYFYHSFLSAAVRICQKLHSVQFPPKHSMFK